VHTYTILKAIIQPYWGWREQVWYHGLEVPLMLFWVLPKRSISKPDQHRKDIQQESSGSDMSWELKNSSYTT